jgi:hypothetical protein
LKIEITATYSMFQASRTVNVPIALMKNSKPKSITSANNRFESFGTS